MELGQEGGVVTTAASGAALGESMRYNSDEDPLRALKAEIKERLKRLKGLHGGAMWKDRLLREAAVAEPSRSCGTRTRRNYRRLQRH